MFKSYFSHRIYCHSKFRELVNLLSGYLISNRYYVGDDYGCEYFKNSNFASVGDYKASVIAAPVKWILKEGHGILFSVVNLRRQCAERMLSYEELPVAIRQRFSTCPNYIEIDTWFKYYGMQKEEGKRLEAWLSDRGFQSYIRYFNGEALDIIETAYLNPFEKAKEFEKLVEDFIPESSISTFKLTDIPNEFLWLIHNISPDALAALKTAEIIRGTLPDLPDFSAVVIEYCKAVEIELNDKLLNPLRTWRITSDISVSSLPTVPGELKRLKKFVFDASPKPLELGTLANTIDASLADNPHPLADNLLTNINALPLPNSPSRLTNDLLFLTRNFRNPAAHKTILSSQQMEKCRDFVVGTSSKPGLLFRIVKAV